MYALAVHGGAGTLPRSQLTGAREHDYRQALAQALSAGQQVLERDGSALDAVEAAVTVLEDDPLFNAGRGAVLTMDGTVELDAAIMDGHDLRAGAVAQVRCVKNPVQLARHLLEHSAHVFLVGEGAERYAAKAGSTRVPNDYFITPSRLEQLTSLRQKIALAGTQNAPSPSGMSLSAPDESPFGTVGAVARDHASRLAAATSTGGMAGKRSGRIGDSPIIGAGTYADTQCAVSATGHGEWLLRVVQAYDIAARLCYGRYGLTAAVDEAIGQRLTRLGASGGLIAVDQHGEIASRFNTAAMFRASVRSGEAASIGIY